MVYPNTTIVQWRQRDALGNIAANDNLEMTSDDGIEIVMWPKAESMYMSISGSP
jgi:hypothetical protein